MQSNEQGSVKSLAERLYDTDIADRPALVAIQDSAERDVLRQLAKGPVWDGNLCSKYGRSALRARGWAFTCNGFNFITRDGAAVVDALWTLEKFIPS